MYQGKRKNKYWSIELKNEVSLLYLDGHMGISQILKEYCDAKLKTLRVALQHKGGGCGFEPLPTKKHPFGVRFFGWNEWTREAPANEESRPCGVAERTPTPT